jgi:hypothetical protein
MKRRHKFELLLKDFERLLADRTRREGDYALFSAVENLVHFEAALAQDPAKIRQLTAFAYALRSSDAIGRQVAEERLMGVFDYIAHLCLDRLKAAGFQRTPAFPPPHEVAAGLQPVVLVLRELRQFALTCFQFKRPRDAFGGRRRALAFDILGKIAFLVDLPDAVQQAQAALRHARSVEARHAATFLQSYSRERDQCLDDATIEQLLALAERTDSRSTALQALGALVETHTISEWEAIDRMDDWKARHR